MLGQLNPRPRTIYLALFRNPRLGIEDIKPPTPAANPDLGFGSWNIFLIWNLGFGFSPFSFCSQPAAAATCSTSLTANLSNEAISFRTTTWPPALSCNTPSHVAI